MDLVWPFADTQKRHGSGFGAVLVCGTVCVCGMGDYLAISLLAVNTVRKVKV